MYVLQIVVCPFVLLVIVLSVLQFTDSDCPFGIFKLFLISKDKTASLISCFKVLCFAVSRLISWRFMSVFSQCLDIFFCVYVRWSQICANCVWNKCLIYNIKFSFKLFNLLMNIRSAVNTFSCTVNWDILAVFLFWFIWCLSLKCQN